MTPAKKERKKEERKEEKGKERECFPVQLGAKMPPAVQRWCMQMIDDITAGLDNNSKQI